MSEFRDYAEWDRHTAINEGYGAEHAVYDPAEMVRAFMAGGCGHAYSAREREEAQARLDELEPKGCDYHVVSVRGCYACDQKREANQ